MNTENISYNFDNESLDIPPTDSDHTAIGSFSNQMIDGRGNNTHSAEQPDDGNFWRDIDSFLPFMRMLRGLQLSVNQTYYLNGVILENEREELLAYTRSIKGYTVTKNLVSEGENPIAPGTLLRVSQLLQDNGKPFFPSLNRLHIIDGAYFAHSWPFFVTPSLQSLEINGIADTQQDVFVPFFMALLNDARGLSSIKFGPGAIPLDIINVCLASTCHLRELCLTNAAGSIVNCKLLRKIGLRLPTLDTLVLDVPESMDFPTKPFAGFQNLNTLRIAGILKVLYPLIEILGRPLKSRKLTTIEVTLTKSLSEKGQAERKKVKGRRPTLKEEVQPNEREGDISLFVDDVLFKWSTTLTSICIRQLDVANHSYCLSEGAFQQLLSQKSLESLKVYGWELNYDVEKTLHMKLADAAPSKLKVLHLPVDTMKGTVSLEVLRLVGEACPDLVSFQCNIQILSVIPDYSDPAVPRNFPYNKLEELIVGGGPLVYPDSLQVEEPYHLLRVAQHLDVLFPNLKVIKTNDGESASTWKYLDHLVKMCQTSRSYHRITIS